MLELSFSGGDDYCGTMTHAPKPRTLLQTLENMAETADESGYTLREIMDRLDERAFGAMLFILALPCAIPFLYLVPQIVAVPMLALAAQMALGRQEPWLPEKLASRRIQREGLMSTARGGRKWLGWIERIARPRLTFLTGKRSEQIIGLFFIAFCLSIMIPLPLTNSTPAIGIAIAAFGLIQRDGLLVILGIVIGAVWISLLIIGGRELIMFLLGLVGIGSGGEENTETALLLRQFLPV